MFFDVFVVGMRSVFHVSAATIVRFLHKFLDII